MRSRSCRWCSTHIKIIVIIIVTTTKNRYPTIINTLIAVSSSASGPSTAATVIMTVVDAWPDAGRGWGAVTELSLVHHAGLDMWLMATLHPYSNLQVRACRCRSWP